MLQLRSDQELFSHPTYRDSRTVFIPPPNWWYVVPPHLHLQRGVRRIFTMGPTQKTNAAEYCPLNFGLSRQIYLSTGTRSRSSRRAVVWSAAAAAAVAEHGSPCQLPILRMTLVEQFCS